MLARFLDWLFVVQVSLHFVIVTTVLVSYISPEAAETGAASERHREREREQVYFTFIFSQSHQGDGERRIACAPYRYTRLRMSLSRI